MNIGDIFFGIIDWFIVDKLSIKESKVLYIGEFRILVIFEFVWLNIVWDI